MQQFKNFLTAIVGFLIMLTASAPSRADVYVTFGYAPGQSPPYGYGAVVLFDETTGQLKNWPVPNPGGVYYPWNALDDPHGVAVTPDGIVYADAFMNASGGDGYLFQFTGYQLGNFLTFPTAVNEGFDGLTLGPDGNLYVCRHLLGDVVSFTTGGVQIQQVTHGINRPVAAAFDQNGTLFVSGLLDGTIWKVTTFGAAPTAFATGLNGPAGLAFDNNGNLYVAAYYGNAIYRFDSNGAAGLSPVPRLVSSNPALAAPHGIAFGPDGNLYVANSGASDVLVIDPASGFVLRSFGGTFGGQTTFFVAFRPTIQVMLYDGPLPGGNLDNTVMPSNLRLNIGPPKYPPLPADLYGEFSKTGVNADNKLYVQIHVASGKKTSLNVSVVPSQNGYTGGHIHAAAQNGAVRRHGWLFTSSQQVTSITTGQHVQPEYCRYRD